MIMPGGRSDQIALEEEEEEDKQAWNLALPASPPPALKAL